MCEVKLRGQLLGWGIESERTLGFWRRLQEVNEGSFFGREKQWKEKQCYNHVASATGSYLCLVGCMIHM